MLSRVQQAPGQNNLAPWLTDYRGNGIPAQIEADAFRSFGLSKSTFCKILRRGLRDVV